MTTLRYVKTDDGRAALKERASDLPRVGRTLLLIIDGTKTGAEWLGLVAGSNDATLQHLLERGYIEPAAAPAPSSPRASATAPTPAPQPTAAADMRDLRPAPAPAPPPTEATTVVSSSGAAFDTLLEAATYRDLYDEMTAQARPLLGLMASYRIVLDIEKCNGVEELRTLARRFVEMVRKEKGLLAADAFCRSVAAHRKA